jgi:hypothetical protein
MPDREKFTNRLRCEGCGRSGDITWEEQAGADRTGGAQRRLIGVSEGFGHHPGRTASGDPAIVCAFCGTTQLD